MTAALRTLALTTSAPFAGDSGASRTIVNAMQAQEAVWRELDSRVEGRRTSCRIRGYTQVTGAITWGSAQDCNVSQFMIAGRIRWLAWA